MPELPEVETVRRGLEPAMLGARFESVTLSRADLRFPFPENFAARLTGRTVTALGRRAKYLVADLDDGAVLIMHLGMSGRFIVEDARGAHEPGDFYQEGNRLTKHDHVVFGFSSGARVTYNDVRRFGFMDLAPRAALPESPHFKGVGIEPLGNALTPALLAEAFAGKSAPLKAVLLDQGIIAGLGNIYVCEALHRAGLSPLRAASTLAEDKALAPKLEKLVVEIRAVLEEAIAAGGSTLRDFAHADGSLGYFQHRFKVYDREGEPCPRPGCSGAILRKVQSGRSSYYCERCQS